jgi:hypothetical protein
LRDLRCSDVCQLRTATNFFVQLLESAGRCQHLRSLLVTQVNGVVDVSLCYVDTSIDRRQVRARFTQLTCLVAQGASALRRRGGVDVLPAMIGDRLQSAYPCNEIAAALIGQLELPAHGLQLLVQAIGFVLQGRDLCPRVRAEDPVRRIVDILAVVLLVAPAALLDQSVAGHAACQQLQLVGRLHAWQIEPMSQFGADPLPMRSISDGDLLHEGIGRWFRRNGWLGKHADVDQPAVQMGFVDMTRDGRVQALFDQHRQCKAAQHPLHRTLPALFGRVNFDEFAAKGEFILT